MKNKINIIISSLALLLMVFFHHWIIDLKFVFPFELFIIIPFLFFNSKYLFKKNSNINRYFIISFALLAILNILSAYNGSINLYVQDFESNIAVSVIYLLMLIYFLFGKTMAYGISKKFIINFMIVSLCLTFCVVLSGYFFVEAKFALIQFYGITSETDLEAINYRSIGPFKNPNNLALMTSFFLAVLSVQEKKIIKKLIFFSMGGFIIFQTASRTGFVIFLLLLLYSLFFVEIKKGRRLKAIIVLCLVILYIVLSDFYKIFEQNRIAETEISTAFDTRLSAYWRETFNLIGNYPFIGTGLIHSDQGTTDNFYLSITKANGFIGLALFLFPFLMTGYLFRHLKKINDTEKTILALLFVFLLSSLSGDFFYSRPYYTFLFCIFGYYVNVYFIDKKELSLTKFKKDKFKTGQIKTQHNNLFPKSTRHPTTN